MEDKCSALRTLALYARTLRLAYAPLLQRTLELMLPALSYLLYNGTPQYWLYLFCSSTNYTYVRNWILNERNYLAQISARLLQTRSRHCYTRAAARRWAQAGYRQSGLKSEQLFIVRCKRRLRLRCWRSNLWLLQRCTLYRLIGFARNLRVQICCLSSVARLRFYQLICLITLFTKFI